jgi:hypothetical protein
MRFPNPFYAIGAFYRAVKRLFSVKPSFVTEETAQKRLKACEECPHFDPAVGQCQVCSCFVILKAQLTTENCPKGRWP